MKQCIFNTMAYILGFLANEIKREVTIMCGIVGVSMEGIGNVKVDLLNSLRRLEYRGYDSVGFALSNGIVEKDVGKIGEFRHGGLHPVGHLVLGNPGQDLRVAHLVGLNLVERIEPVQHRAAIGHPVASGIVEVEYRVAL